jgi:BlaI family transcriptional regulator, penicillinase repressor
MREGIQLGKLQLEIMRVVWSVGEATVTDVHKTLEPTHGLAPTTIATMLKKMEAKGVVAHRSEGRRFVYRPTVTEEAVTRSMVADLTDRLFGGDPAALAAHLLEDHEVDGANLEELRRLIDAARREDRR